MKGWRHRIAFLLLCITTVNRLSAASYPIKYLGIEDGLSNNAVTNIYQDDKGFLWFGTYDGLNRYDGYKFKIYRNKIGDSASLMDNGIYTIEGDLHHKLWIGGRKGVSVFDPVNEKFSIARYLPAGSSMAGPVSGNIHIIKAGKEGIILIGSESNGLLLFEGDMHTGRQVPLHDGPQVITAYEVTAVDYEPGGRYAWVFVQGKGLCRYDAVNKTLQVVNKDINKGNCLKADSKGLLWLGTDNGLFRYDRRSNTYSANYIKESSKIVNLCMDKQGVLWIASDGNGMFVLHTPGEQATHFPAPGSKQQLSSNAVYSIYEDREGRKWIGTLRGGINIIEPRPHLFELYAFNDDSIFGSINNFIFSFCEDEGNIWIGTDGGGLKYWNREHNTYTRYTRNPAVRGALSSNFITSIIRDAGGDIWLSTWFRGVNRYNRATRTFEHFSCFNPFTGMEESNVWLVYEDAQKTLWASTTNNGTLYTFNRAKGKFEIFDRSIVNIQCLAEDSKGNLWGGNYTQLIRIDRARKQHKVYNIGYTIRAIHEDKRGNFWLGTDGGGLLLFNTRTGSFTAFTDADGLPNNSILRVLEDDNGNLWLSTYNGLSRFDPQKKVFRNFSQSDGLQSNQFTYNAALKLKSGEFMFGGIKGFNIFHPDSVYQQTTTPPLLLTGVKINNVPVEQHDVQELKIPYDKAIISFDFVALEYSSPDKISYAYYLDGWDKGWNYVGEARTANYTRLQEGNYVFKIKATNADGKWGREVRTVSITVLPPWYRTWWARMLYITFIGAGIWFFIQYRSRQERLQYEIKLAHLENEKEKEINERKLSFFTNISHEFRTPLTLIINPLKEFIQNQERSEHNEPLGVVYRNARRLLSLVDQLLLFRTADTRGDQLKVTRLNMVELCNEVYLCFSQQAKARRMQYHFCCSREHIMLYADYEKLEIALFNLLSNAFKFTPDEGSILLELQETESEVTLLIKDNGCGIPADMGNRIFDKFQRAGGRQEHLQTGFGIGLYLVKHFIESHKGAITYSSPANEGTAFFIRLRKGKAHLAGADLAPDTPARSGILHELADGTDLTVNKENKRARSPLKQVEELVTEKRSILLIDDNAEILEYLRQLFANRFIIYEAGNGDEGFALVEKHMPDLVISDIQMEGMNGVELCTRIKQTETLSHIPVILLTSASAADVKIKGLEEGADDYITKPFDKELLLVKVDNIIKNRHLLRQYFLDSITLKHTSIRVPADYRDFLNQCIQIVEANLDNEDFSIKTFTQAIGMSHSSLYKKVKSMSGQTINAFIRSIRLRKAAVLMLKENYTINQAAQQVGIGDIRYFREQFFKLFGMNPSEYVKKYRPSFNGDLNVVKI
jgi:signal transduction histidine kinase/ligand-binding sensor domain-containing protein/DNA-binding response OmpR family regulator